MAKLTAGGPEQASPVRLFEEDVTQMDDATLEERIKQLQAIRSTKPQKAAPARGVGAAKAAKAQAALGQVFDEDSVG